MADGLHVELKDGARIQAGLRVAPQRMKQELRRSHGALARMTRGWLRAAALSATPQQRHMAGGIGSSANSTSASVTMRNTARAPGAMGAFLGSLRYRQFPPPIAPGWKVGGPGGPMVVNPTLRRRERDIDDLFIDGQMAAVIRAFPRGTR